MTNIRKTTQAVGERSKEIINLSMNELVQERIKYWQRLKNLPETLQHRMQDDDFTTQDAYDIVFARTVEYRAILHCIKLKKMQAEMEKLEGIA